ncbi:unnamed protein product, partial [Ixodes hexagonus]
RLQPRAHRSLTAVDKVARWKKEGGAESGGHFPAGIEPAPRRGEAPSPPSADVPLTQFQRLDSGRAARRLRTGWSAPRRQDCIAPSGHAGFATWSQCSTARGGLREIPRAPALSAGPVDALWGHNLECGLRITPHRRPCRARAQRGRRRSDPPTPASVQ